MLGAVCSDVILSIWASSFVTGDMKWFSQLSWKTKASWYKSGYEEIHPCLCQ